MSLASISELLTNSASNVLQTKTLESAMVDYSDATAYTLDQTLVSHWLWLAHRNLYIAQIGVENPRTGERIVLPAKDAYALMMYAFCQTIGFTLDVIPPFFGMHVQRIPSPSPEDLLSVVDPKRVSRDLAVQMLSYTPLIQRVISSEAFYNQCHDIWRAKNIQNNLVASQEHFIVRGYVDNMMNRCYGDVMCDLFPGENYTAWFAARNLEVETFTRDEFGLLYTSLMRTATGIDLLSTNSVASLQAAMLGLLTQLSSYSVQVMSYINSGSIVPLGWPVLRQGDWKGHVKDAWQDPDAVIDVLDFRTHIKSEVFLPLHDQDFDEQLATHIGDAVAEPLPNPVSFTANKSTVYHLRLDLPTQASYVEAAPADTEGMIPVLGLPHYLSLTPEQRSHFKDIYGNHYGERP